MFKGLPGSQPFHSIKCSGNFGAGTLHLSEKGPPPTETTGKGKSEQLISHLPFLKENKAQMIAEVQREDCKVF